jgi:hypothetical protein
MALRRAVPALVLVASVVAAVTAVTVAAAARPAAATADGTEVGIVGDSIPFAMEWYASAGALDPLAARRYWIDTLACRTTTAVTSCPRLPSISPATQVIADHAAAAPRVLVVALGANESPSSFAGGLRAVLAAARAVGVERVLWLTVVERGPDAARFAVINQLIREAAAEEPDLVVGEWGAAQAPHPAWSDGPDVHLSLVGARAMASFIADQVAPLLAGRCGPSVAGVGADPGPVVTRGADPGPSGRLTPVGPERLADTRSGAPVEAGKVLPVPVAGRPGVPADATGALVTVTAVDACAAGYLTAYDCGPLPWASNLDVDRGGTRAATTAPGGGPPPPRAPAPPPPPPRPPSPSRPTAPCACSPRSGPT